MEKKAIEYEKPTDLVADEIDDDDKSMDDNLDEEEMPDDNDYNRRVQLLHENR